MRSPLLIKSLTRDSQWCPAPCPPPLSLTPSYNVVARARVAFSRASLEPRRATSSIIQMAPSTAPGNPQVAANTDSSMKPSWDTSPNTFPQYYQRLLKWVSKQDSRFLLLVQYYIALDRGVICCMSDNHVARIRNRLVTKGSFKNPTRVLASDAVMVPPSGPPPTPPPASTTSGAPSSAPDTSAPTALPTASPTSSDHAARPMVVERVDTDLWLLLQSTIDDEDTVAELLSAIGSESGVGLLIHFKNKNDNIANSLGTSYADHILKQMADLEEVGLSSPRVAEFNAFKTNLNNLRMLLPDEVPCSDPTFAHKLVVAVRKLGPFVESELNNALRIDKSRGNLTKTKDTIVAVLSELEPTSVESSNRALLSRGDPSTGRGKGKGGEGRGAGRGRGKDGRGGGGGAAAGAAGSAGRHPDRPWQVSDGYCRWCKIMGNEKGGHWNSDHPDIPAAQAKKAADKAAETAAAPAAAPAGRGLLVRDDEILSAASTSTPGYLDVSALDSLHDTDLLGAIISGGEGAGRGLMVRQNTDDSQPCGDEAHWQEGESESELHWQSDDESEGEGVPELTGPPSSSSHSSSPAPSAPASPPDTPVSSSVVPASVAVAPIQLPPAPTFQLPPTPEVDPFAPGDPRPRRPPAEERVYVVGPSPHDSLAGVYSATWGPPDELSRIVGGRTASGLTCKRIKSATLGPLEAAAVYCRDHAMPQAAIYRGPHIRSDYPDVAIGFNLLHLIGPPEEAVEAAAGPLEPDIAEVEGPAPAQSAPAALPPSGSVPVVLHDVARRMFDMDHPSRQLLRSSLADLYRLSPREGFSPPPGAPGPNFVGGTKSINAGSIAKYVLDQAGLAESKARARREHPARGSRCLLRALSGVRSSLSLMLRSMANGESEPLLEASAADALAAVVLPDFQSARDVAASTPRTAILGTSVSTTVLDGAARAVRYVGHLMVQALVVGLAVYAGAAAYHDPGAWAVLAFFPAAVALLPLLLAVTTVRTISRLSRPLLQAEAGGGAAFGSTVPRKTRPPPPGRPPGRSACRPLPSSHSVLSHSSSEHRRMVTRAASVLLASELTPLSCVSLPANLVFTLVALYFMVGASSLRSRRPPSHSLKSALPPSGLRAAVCSTARTVVSSLGRVALFIRRFPLRCVHLVYVLSVLCCLGFLPRCGNERTISVAMACTRPPPTLAAAACLGAAAPASRPVRRFLAGGRPPSPLAPPASTPGGPVPRPLCPPASLAGGRCSLLLSILSWPGKIVLTAFHSTIYAGFGFTTLPHLDDTPDLSTLALTAGLPPVAPSAPKVPRPLPGRALLSKTDHHRLSIKPSCDQEGPT